MKKIMVTIAVIISMASIAGCGLDKATEPYKDAPRGDTNKNPADIIEMPDGFNNLATKCDHGFRIYVTYHSDSPYGAVAAVPDSSCAQE